jgi:endonuclease YncB( thermonuclease family)
VSNRRTPAEFRDWPDDLQVGYGPYRARIRYHVDGDTYDAFVDLGGRCYAYWPIRLLGCDTPELNRGSSREAGFRALGFVQDVMPIGSPVVLAETRKDPDSFGRYLCKITLRGGVDLTSMLIDAGHAWAVKG